MRIMLIWFKRIYWLLMQYINLRMSQYHRMRTCLFRLEWSGESYIYAGFPIYACPECKAIKEEGGQGTHKKSCLLGQLCSNLRSPEKSGLLGLSYGEKDR